MQKILKGGHWPLPWIRPWHASYVCISGFKLRNSWWFEGPAIAKILYKISNLPDFMQNFKISAQILITLFFNYRRRQRIYINISNH